jgi:hypothetical protein
LEVAVVCLFLRLKLGDRILTFGVLRSAGGDVARYVIPAGNQVCVSPSVNGRNPAEWDDADKFVVGASALSSVCSAAMCLALLTKDD